jgi:hypothetical protein
MASELEDRRGLPVEVREVLNYVVAAEEGFAWVADRPITVGLIERLHNCSSLTRRASAMTLDGFVRGRFSSAPAGCP